MQINKLSKSATTVLLVSLQKSRALPSVKCFSECQKSGTRQSKALGKAFTECNSAFACVLQSLPEKSYAPRLQFYQLIYH